MKLASVAVKFIAARLRGGRQGATAPSAPLDFLFWYSDRFSSPTRRAARGGRAPCTPGPGLRPWEPRFDAWAKRMLDAHAYGQMGAASSIYMFWHSRSMRRWIARAASITCRGSGGQHAHPAGARGAAPARILSPVWLQSAGSTRGSACSHPRASLAPPLRDHR